MLVLILENIDSLSVSDAHRPRYVKIILKIKLNFHFTKGTENPTFLYDTVVDSFKEAWTFTGHINDLPQTVSGIYNPYKNILT